MFRKRIISKAIRLMFGYKSLPRNYHTDYREDINKYFWYYIGRHNGKKDYCPNTYFAKHKDAVNDAIKYYKQTKK